MKQRESRKLIFLFMLVYFVSYITRTNYSAVVLEIIRVEHLSASLASLVLSGSAITYGIGQLLSGYIGDKIQPRKLILCGLLITSLMNLLLPFCHTPYEMTLVWCINGLAQSFLWPPLVCLMAALFTKEAYQKSCVFVSFGGSLGTISVYLLSPLFLSFTGWRSIFLFSSLCALLMSAVWYKKCPTISRSDALLEHHEDKRKQHLTIPWSALLFGIMFSILLQGMLRDGVTTWMPSYISDTFHLDSKISIFAGIILPIFSVLAFQATSIIYHKAIHNELTLSAILFFISFSSALLLTLSNGWSTILSVILSALLTGCMHGVNLMLVCIIPRYFSRYGCISFISGLLNFCTYIGSAVSTYGMAAYSEVYGWSNLIKLWSLIALVGSLLCLVLTKQWKRFTKA